MSQESQHQTVTIQDTPSILKLARQKAALGLYQEAIRTYNKALTIIGQHYKMQNDPFLKEQWKKTDEEIKAEITGIYNLFKSLKNLRGHASDAKEPMTDIPFPLEAKEVGPQKMDIQPEPPIQKNMKNMIEHFGGVPFSKKEERPVQKVKPLPREENVVYSRENLQPQKPEKDPLVWDPPSPPHQPKQRKPVKQKNLPQWAKQGSKQKPPQKPPVAKFLIRFLFY